MTEDKKLKDLHIGLLFSYGLSLKKWNKAGLLFRDTQLYTELQKQGAKVSFITYGDKLEKELANKVGISVISNTEKLFQPFYYIFLNLLKFRELKKIDVIKSHQFIGVWPAVLLKVFFGKKYIARGGYIPSFFAKNSGKKGVKSSLKYILAVIDEFMVCKFADAVVVPSQEEIDYLKSKYNLKDKKAKINTNWIDTDLFKPDQKIEKKSRSIVFVGRFETQKNPLMFLESIKNIENLKATMIGAGSFLSEMQKFIKKNNINCQVYTDRIANNDLPEILNKHEIYVLPTRFEGGSPKTILEAMSCGLPIISTDTFGTKNAFIDKKHGIKVELKVESIEKAVKYLLANPNERKKFGEQARDHIKENFSLEKVLNRELEIINLII